MAFLVVDDLPVNTGSGLGLTVEQMIEDTEAMAVLAAPCIAADPSELTAPQQAALKAILRGAIMRWSDSGTGAVQSQTAGPFGQTLDTRQARRSMFWPSEITQLQSLCGGGTSSGAFSVDTALGTYGLHADICSLNFGALYCSCGVDIAGYPLFGT